MPHTKKISVYCDWDTMIATVILNRFGGGKRTHKLKRHSPSAGRLVDILMNSPNIYYSYYGHYDREAASWHKADKEPTTHYYYRAEPCPKM